MLEVQRLTVMELMHNSFSPYGNTVRKFSSKHFARWFCMVSWIYVVGWCPCASDVHIAMA